MLQQLDLKVLVILTGSTAVDLILCHESVWKALLPCTVNFVMSIFISLQSG